MWVEAEKTLSGGMLGFALPEKPGSCSKKSRAHQEFAPQFARFQEPGGTAPSGCYLTGNCRVAGYSTTAKAVAVILNAVKDLRLHFRPRNRHFVLSGLPVIREYRGIHSFLHWSHHSFTSSVTEYQFGSSL